MVCEYRHMVNMLLIIQENKMQEEVSPLYQNPTDIFFADINPRRIYNFEKTQSSKNFEKKRENLEVTSKYIQIIVKSRGTGMKTDNQRQEGEGDVWSLTLCEDTKQFLSKFSQNCQKKWRN